MGVINQSLLRDINTGLIMRMILEHSPISRTDLAEKSGLAPSTVTSITSDLQEKQYIRECGRASSTGGRRQILLAVNPEGGYFVGAEINEPTSHIGILDLAGNLVVSANYRTATEGSEAVFLQLVSEINRQLDWCRQQEKPMLGIGLSITGMVDSTQGTVMKSVALDLTDFPLMQRLKEHFDHPMTLENEASAAAFGEYRSGVQQTGSKNMLYVTIGAGIGAGIIVNGALYAGSHGTAGEIGHATVDPLGPTCQCGKRGCLEVYASGPALMAAYRRKGGEVDLANFAALPLLAQAGDPAAASVLIEAGRLIGIAIGNQVNVLDLDTVVLGGELLEFHSVLFDVISETTLASVLPMMKDGVVVQKSALGMHAALVGAAILHWQHIFS